MRKSLFVLESVATWATISNAVAQYVTLPGNDTPQPGYIHGSGPSRTPPGYLCRTSRVHVRHTTPGNMSREQWLNEEGRLQPGENYEKQRTLNDTTGSGAIGLTNPNAVGGECAKGFSEETCRRRGQRYNPPRQD